MPLSIDEMLKSLVCPKKTIPHMTKTIYSPSCLRYCAELCGVRCRNLCNKNHIGCSQGVLPETFADCPSSARMRDSLAIDFITYENQEVETFGKGKPFARMEKISTSYNFKDFMVVMKNEFSVYVKHTMSHWFLRAT